MSRGVPAAASSGFSASEMKVDPLFSEEQIRVRVEELARDVSRAFSAGTEGAPPALALVLANGALFFAADLLRKLDFPAEIEVVRVASYGAGTRSNGAPEILGGVPAEKIRGRRVLVIDDVLDTGRTLEKIRRTALECGAAEVLSCVLLDKPSRRETTERADFVGFPVGDVFVVGYGLDLGGAWRALPFIGAVSAE